MISIIIPVREGGHPYITLQSLAGITPDCEIVISWDHGMGANWARNRGAERARGDLLLFSDDDIVWKPWGVQVLADALAHHPEASYSYGSYEMAGKVQCDIQFNADHLKRANFISTMSMIRREVFPGFDENIQRLQDWDLWLCMLERGHIGIYCGSMIFSTRVRPGITEQGTMDYSVARRIVSEKHGLGLT